MMRHSQIPAIEKGSVVTSFSGATLSLPRASITHSRGFLAAEGDEDTGLVVALQPRHVVVE